MKYITEFMLGTHVDVDAVWLSHRDGRSSRSSLGSVQPRSVAVTDFAPSLLAMFHLDTFDQNFGQARLRNSVQACKDGGGVQT